ncbi:bifunctional folylpolyglutamate synthase/dihydrofolate synthase [Viridibacillus sp. YIM B01967]|uniref:tetrahydrofolate synthase n=1 Tax=Viridibacillus soli TaxID=2798301 RepID=A0ABS1H218_9BACL|nr:folylpolyglutamate synthase/dihydrofolate synthase family protein [Viridibacillus soli]MBK3493453.1 bifunctional folylpolyglutamate synthase/dihydrofolate synthase [Viridibacillus soli]
MFTNIEQCVDFLSSLKKGNSTSIPLEVVKSLLHEFGDPERTFKTIHVAGSNGKGSTLNALKEILMHSHVEKIGCFVSPHLERINERITISNTQISDEQFLYYVNKVFAAIDAKNGVYPSFFEIMTIVAFLHFANEKVDVALIETGIGGSLDSTNVIDPLVSIITTISLEHTAILGDTYEKIAYQKGGIIKENRPVVTTVENVEALAVLRKIAEEQHAPIAIFNEDFTAIKTAQKEHTQLFNYAKGDYVINDIELRMAGPHQINNASLAITTALLLNEYENFYITEEAIRIALKEAKWAGRFEEYAHHIVIDGAHNPEGTKALIATLKATYPTREYDFIYAALQDKDHQNSIKMMEEVASSMTFTQINMPNAESAKELAALSHHHKTHFDANWESALKQAVEQKDEEHVLVITGSLYFISEVRTFLKSKVEQ